MGPSGEVQSPQRRGPMGVTMATQTPIDREQSDFSSTMPRPSVFRQSESPFSNTARGMMQRPTGLFGIPQSPNDLIQENPELTSSSAHRRFLGLSQVNSPNSNLPQSYLSRGDPPNQMNLGRLISPGNIMRRGKLTILFDQTRS